MPIPNNISNCFFSPHLNQFHNEEENEATIINENIEDYYDEIDVYSFEMILYFYYIWKGEKKIHRSIYQVNKYSHSLTLYNECITIDLTKSISFQNNLILFFVTFLNNINKKKKRKRKRKRFRNKSESK